MNQFFKETASDKKIRVATSVTVVILALCAGVLSYDALRNLAVQAGIPSFLAILFPITIDGLILSGSLLMLFFANKGKRSAYGFFLTALGVVSSVAGNVAVSVDTLVSQLVHATSPVVLFLSIEALTILLRWRSKMAAEAAEAAELAEAKEEEERHAKKIEAEAAATTTMKSENTSPGYRSRWTPTTNDTTPGSSVSPGVSRTTISANVDAPLTPAKSSEGQLDQSRSYEAPRAVPEAPKPPVVTAAPRDVEKAWNTSSLSATPVPTASAPKNIPDSTPSAEPVSTPKPAPVKPAKETPKGKVASSGGPTLRERINEILDRNPNATVDHIGDQLEGDRKYVRKLAREEMNKRNTAA